MKGGRTSRVQWSHNPSLAGPQEPPGSFDRSTTGPASGPDLAASPAHPHLSSPRVLGPQLSIKLLGSWEAANGDSTDRYTGPGTCMPDNYTQTSSSIPGTHMLQVTHPTYMHARHTLHIMHVRYTCPMYTHQVHAPCTHVRHTHAQYVLGIYMLGAYMSGIHAMRAHMSATDTPSTHIPGTCPRYTHQVHACQAHKQPRYTYPRYAHARYAYQVHTIVTHEYTRQVHTPHVHGPGMHPGLTPGCRAKL